MNGAHLPFRATQVLPPFPRHVLTKFREQGLDVLPRCFACKGRSLVFCEVEWLQQCHTNGGGPGRSLVRAEKRNEKHAGVPQGPVPQGGHAGSCHKAMRNLGRND